MNNNREYLDMYFKDIKKVQAYSLNNRLENTFDKCLPLLKKFEEEFCNYSSLYGAETICDNYFYRIGFLIMENELKDKERYVVEKVQECIERVKWSINIFYILEEQDKDIDDYFDGILRTTCDEDNGTLKLLTENLTGLLKAFKDEYSDRINIVRQVTDLYGAVLRRKKVYDYYITFYQNMLKQYVPAEYLNTVMNRCMYAVERLRENKMYVNALLNGECPTIYKPYYGDKFLECCRKIEI